MTREEMLKAMGLTRHEFEDFLGKYKAFFDSLSPAQRKIVERAHPTLHEIARSFGPGCTVENVEELLRLVPTASGEFLICWMGCLRSGK